MRKLLLCLMAFGILACSEKKEDTVTIVVEDAFNLDGEWMRPAPEGANTAAYLTIRNGLAEGDTLLSASSDLSDDVQIHETITDADGFSKMQHIGKIAVSPTSTVELKPGGKHIMLLGIKQDIAPGDTITVSLNFAKNGVQELAFPVEMNQ